MRHWVKLCNANKTRTSWYTQTQAHFMHNTSAVTKATATNRKKTQCVWVNVCVCAVRGKKYWKKEVANVHATHTRKKKKIWKNQTRWNRREIDRDERKINIFIRGHEKAHAAACIEYLENTRHGVVACVIEQVQTAGTHPPAHTHTHTHRCWDWMSKSKGSQTACQGMLSPREDRPGKTPQQVITKTNKPLLKRHRSLKALHTLK